MSEKTNRSSVINRRFTALRLSCFLLYAQSCSQSEEPRNKLLLACNDVTGYGKLLLAFLYAGIFK